jgi:hypothetical protein
VWFPVQNQLRRKVKGTFDCVIACSVALRSGAIAS